MHTPASIIKACFVLVLSFLSTSLLFALSTSTKTDQLFAAITQNDTTSAIEALATGANSNAIRVVPIFDWAGMQSRSQYKADFQAKITPLALAVHLKNYTLSAALLKQGANPNIYAIFDSASDRDTGMWEHSPLFLALEDKDPRMLKLLLDHGADPFMQVRYFGGERPPADPSEIDKSTFGYKYYRDTRARISALDLILVPRWNSSLMWTMLISKYPTLKALSSLSDGLFHAAMTNDLQTFEKCLARGDRANRETLLSLLRLGKTNLLKILTNYQTIPGNEALWLDTARTARLIDTFWYNKVLPNYTRDALFPLEVEQEFITAMQVASPSINRVQTFLESMSNTLTNESHQTTKLELPLAALVLFDSWLQPLPENSDDDPLSFTRKAPKQTSVSRAYANLVASQLIGLWSTESEKPWKLDIRSQTLRNFGYDTWGKSFDITYAPWRLAMEEAPLEGPANTWVVRINKDDKVWMSLTLINETLNIYDTVDKTTVTMRRINK